MNGSLTIVSCGLTTEDLSDEYRVLVTQADVLAGGQRLLDGFPDFTGEKVSVGAHARDTARELAARSETERIVILASGDALFFGIGSLFVPLVPQERLTILPNLTAAQLALSRLNISWPQSRFFSAHGRKRNLPWQTILRSQSAVVYADPDFTPAHIAAQLMERFPACAERPAAIVENLGNDECIQQGTISQMAQASCGGFSMLVLCPTSEGLPPLSLGLPDDTYIRENNLITRPEVRAVVLSKLRLVRGVLWDLGAGSGSVGIEAAGLCEGLRVHSVERKQERCEHIRENAVQRGCPTVQVHEGHVLEQIPELPEPDRIFIGGGGADIIEITEAAFASLKPGGLLVASAVMLETRNRLSSMLKEHQLETIELDVKRAQAIGSGQLMKPENPIMIIVFGKDLA